MARHVVVVDEAPAALLGEGPFWDAQESRLLWVDIVGRRVHAYSPGGGEVRSWETPLWVSAAIPTTRGDLILALQDGLYRFAPSTGELRLFSRPDLDPQNRSNECRCDPQGRLWLGTMQNNIAEDGSSRPVTGASGGLFVVDAKGGSARLLSDIGIANTLAWSPDGAQLYFADSRRNVIWRFRYEPEGPRLHARETFVDGGPGAPDGSAMDVDGHLWTARWGAGCIIRYAPDGRVDQIIEVPVRQPSSCVFGGPDLTTLFVTSARHGLATLGDADGRLLRLEEAGRGLPLPIFAG